MGSYHSLRQRALDAERELDEIKKQMAAALRARKLHRANHRGLVCNECNQAYPCLTASVFDAVPEAGNL